MAKDLRVEEVMSLCGDIENEQECEYYKPSSYRKCCFYNRFGFVCDRLIVNPQQTVEEK